MEDDVGLFNSIELDRLALYPQPGATGHMHGSAPNIPLETAIALQQEIFEMLGEDFAMVPERQLAAQLSPRPVIDVCEYFPEAGLNFDDLAEAYSSDRGSGKCILFVT